MTEKRQRMISAMKYIVLAIIVGYLVILMLYASGSKRAFSEVSKAVSSVLDSKELVQMDDQMLKRNYGLNSADYKGVLYYSSPSSISAAEVLVIQVKNETLLPLHCCCLPAVSYRQSLTMTLSVLLKYSAHGCSQMQHLPSRSSSSVLQSRRSFSLSQHMPFLLPFL